MYNTIPIRNNTNIQLYTKMAVCLKILPTVSRLLTKNRLLTVSRLLTENRLPTVSGLLTEN